MAYFPGAKLLRTGGWPRNASNFPSMKAFRIEIVFLDDPFDVVDGIEPDIGGHQRNQHVLRRMRA